MAVLLLLGACAAGAFGLITFVSASTVFVQIEALIFFLIGAVLLSGALIVNAIDKTAKPEAEKQKDLPPGTEYL